VRALVLTFFLIALGCGSEPEFKVPPPSTTRLPVDSDAPYYDRINDLGFELARAMDLDENVAFSPVSIGHNLSVLMDGASGKTRDELLRLFKLTESSKPAFDESQRALLNQLQGIPGRPIHVPSAVFLVWPVVLDKAFVERNGKRYGSVVAKVGGATIEAKRMMNAWVSDETDGRITDLVTQVNPEDAVFVINVVNFQDKWLHPFSKSRTVSAPFHTPGREVQVPMMSQTKLLSYSEDASFQAVALGYNSPGLVFVALLPKGDVGLGDAMKNLTAKSWRSLWEGRAARNVAVSLPRFAFENEYDLVPAVKSLGVQTMFTSQANFRNMSIEMERGFGVPLMKHRAVIAVDEEGTVASAATVAKIAAGVEDDPPVEFNANRPFAYAIVDSKTSVVCFFGVVNDPAKKR
jgi:serpin B